MNPEINLLTDLQAKNRLARRNLWRFLIFSLFFAFAVLVVWAWLWSSSIVLNRKDAVLDADINSLQDQIKSQERIEQRQTLLIDRLKNISSLLAKRPELAERLIKLTELLPGDIIITDIQLSADKDEVTVKLSAATYQSFVESVRVLRENESLAMVMLEEIARKNTGDYNLTLEIKDK